jgi:predicted dehydrogenase
MQPDAVTSAARVPDAAVQGKALSRPAIRAAVIGAGQIAQQHLRCLAQLPGVQIVGVCDLSPSLAEFACERYGARQWYTDHARMLQAVDAHVVHVATPPASHFRLASDCLQAGAHVFLEKPATTSLADTTALVTLAEGKGRALVEDYNYLWNEPIVRLRDWSRQGVLGRIHHVDVALCLDILGEDSPFMDRNLRHPALDLAGGPIEDFLPHLASLAHALCGAHVEARATWEKRNAGSPLPYDEFRALVRCMGATASLTFSGHAQPDSFRVTAYGSRARATADIFEHRVTRAHLRRGPKPLVPFCNALDEAGRTGASAFQLLWRKLSGGPGAYGGLWRLISHFYRALGGAGPLPLTLKEVLEVNRMVDALLAGRTRA